MATRFGLLLPHFGEEADQDLLIDGVRLAERLGFDSIWVRDHLVFHPHGMEGTDRTFIEPFITLSFLAGATERIGLGAATIIPFRHPIIMAYIGRLDVLADPPPVRPGRRRGQLPARVRCHRPVGRRPARDDEGAGPHRPRAVDRRERRASQRPVRLRRRGPQAPAGAPGARLVGWRDARLGAPRGRLLRGLAARPHHVPDLRGARRQDPRDDRRAGQADDHGPAPCRSRSIDSDPRGRHSRGSTCPGLIKNANAQKFWLKPDVGRVHDASRSSMARSWPARPTTSWRACSATRRSAADLLIFDFRMRFPDWLEQIETLARDVFPRVGAGPVGAAAR